MAIICFQTWNHTFVVVYPSGVSPLGLVDWIPAKNPHSRNNRNYPVSIGFQFWSFKILGNHGNHSSWSNFTMNHGLSMSYFSNDNKLTIDSFDRFAFNRWFIDCHYIHFNRIDNSSWINYTIKHFFFGQCESTVKLDWRLIALLLYIDIWYVWYEFLYFIDFQIIFPSIFSILASILHRFS